MTEKYDIIIYITWPEGDKCLTLRDNKYHIIIYNKADEDIMIIVCSLSVSRLRGLKIE